MEDYIEVTILVLDEFKEIISAELVSLDYEGIWDDNDKVKGYIPKAAFNHKALYDMLSKYNIENNFTYEDLQPQNWNEVWESNYQPIAVQNEVLIRSPFHAADANYSVEVIIQPQMSFGTGHHETTQLMIEMMLTLDYSNAEVLDMGTGTGVLAIYARLTGAKSVLGIDNDLNSVQNAQDNLKYNPVTNVEFIQGSAEALPTRTFDLVLSNITKNINMMLLPDLAKRVKQGGHLILAGFLNFDLKEVDEFVTKLGFEIVRNISKHDWECLMYKKVTT